MTPLILRRRFAAPCEAVFDAWTDPALFAQWIGPVGVPCTLTGMNAVPGGQYSLTMHLPDGSTIPVAGTYSALDRPHHLAFTWGHADGHIVTQVEIWLRPTETGCEMEFHHHLPDTLHASHDGGWTSAFGKLQTLIEG